MTEHHAPPPTSALPLDGSWHRAHRTYRPRRAVVGWRAGGPANPHLDHTMRSDHPQTVGTVAGESLAEETQVAARSHLLDDQVGFFADDKRPVAEPVAEDLAEHLARIGDRPDCSGAAGPRLIEGVAAAGLSGRGGGHFPTAGKLRAALRAVQSESRADRLAFVVANGAEGEPASVKDAALIQSRPHLVIDGLVCAAEVIGAQHAVIWLHEHDHGSYDALSAALRQRRANGIAEPAVRIMVGRSHYLTGESRSVVAGVSGRLPLPYFTRVPTATAGIGGHPTLIQNVETLARLALIARTGPQHPMPGPLLSVLGQAPDGSSVLIAREGSADQTVAETIDVGWQRPGRPQAVLVGGYGGTWLRWDEVAGLRIAELDRRPAELGPHQASLGPGILLALPRQACPVQETAAVVAYLASSSARQCGPCTRGGPAIAQAWQRLAESRVGRSAERKLLPLAAQLDGRGACALPDAIARITRSALRAFADDVSRHESGAGCAGQDAPLTLPVPDLDVLIGG